MIQRLSFVTTLFVSVVLLPAAPTLPAERTSLQIDPAQTHVEWTLSSVLHTVHGTFRLKRGDIQFNPSNGSASGELVVDAASGESGNGSRDGKMHKQVLESARYSDIVFRPDRVEGVVAAQGASEVRLHGTITLHGSEHELVMPVSVQAVDGGGYSAKAHFEVPYVAWGMKNPSTLMLRVSDKVELTVETVAHPAR